MRISRHSNFALLGRCIFPLMFLGCLGFPQHSQAQLRLAANVALAVQNLTIAEATLTDGFKPRLLLQGGILASYGFGKGIVGRLGLRFDAHGFQSESKPLLDHVYDHFWTQYRIGFAKATLGIGYGGAVSKRLVLSGAVDFVFGMPFRARTREVVDGKLLRAYPAVTDFYNDYWGLDLGLSLHYMLPSGISIGLSPTFQTQINQVLDSDIFIYRFVGFAPRVEVGFPLSKKK